MELKTLTSGAGVSTTFSLTYLPQYLYYTAATQLESLKVSVLGDGIICDLDANGLSSIGIFTAQGRVTNGYMIPLASGFFPGKNVTITATNSAVQTPTIYGASNNVAVPGKGLYVQCEQQTALAKSGVTLNKFLSLHVPNAGASDIINIQFADGHVENDIVRAELPFWQELIQYVSNSASDYIISNVAQTIKKVSIIPTAEQIVYTTSFWAPGSKKLV